MSRPETSFAASSPEEAARIKRSNRRQLTGFAIVIGTFAGMPLYELARHFLN